MAHLRKKEAIFFGIKVDEGTIHSSQIKVGAVKESLNS